MDKDESSIDNCINQADGTVFIFDLSNMDSVDYIEQKIIRVKELKGEIPGIIIGNKNDLKNTNSLQIQNRAKELAKKNNFQYFETSAKNNTLLILPNRLML